MISSGRPHERAATDEQDVGPCPSGCTAARDACGHRWGGTLETVPSRIFRRDCWTPSPADVARDRDVALEVLRDLVDLVDVNDAAARRCFEVEVGGLERVSGGGSRRLRRRSPLR